MRHSANSSPEPTGSSQTLAADAQNGREKPQMIAQENARAGLTRSQQLGILAAFWLYITLTNIFFAASLAEALDPGGTKQLFAHWSVRTLQHLFLFPLFVASAALSLRVGWRPHWRAIPVQTLIAIVFSVSAAPLMVAANVLLHWNDLDADVPGFSIWFASAVSYLLYYGFGLALITGLALYARIRAAEKRQAALERAWSEARLSALRMQLSPHTLFNLLHAIRGQIAWDPATAQAMIVQLGDLLRKLLAVGEREFSTLRAELEFVRLYLDLQQRRFEDRLRIEVDEPDDLPPVWVPSLILQPLVENAVVHGLAGHDGPVQLGIQIRVSGGALNIRVTNHAVPAKHAGEGIGIRNVRERLEVHFGGEAGLRAGMDGPDIWVSELRMPLLLAEPHAAPVET